MSVMPQGAALPATARTASRPGTPTSATTPGPAGAGAAGGATAGGGFAALVAVHVDAMAGQDGGGRGAPGTATAAGRATGTGTGTETCGERETDAETGAEQAGTPAVVDPTAVLLAALPLPQQPGATGQQTATDGAATTTGSSADGSAPTDLVELTAPTAPTAPEAPTAAGPQQHGPQQHGPQHGAETAAPAQTGPQDTASTRADQADRAAQPGPGRADLAALDGASPATAPDAAGATTATTAPAGTTPAPPSPTTRQVTGQVFPEVVRLAQTQAGPGQRTTQHLTLRLDPGTLGEVRVTLSMGEHGLRVRMVAAHEGARDALQQGAPELQRLLEHLGETRVSVRDAAGAPAAAAATPGSASAQDARGDAPGSWSGSDHTDSGERPSGDASRQQERQARTSADHVARDGTTRPAHPGSLGAGSADPQTSGARRALDVSM
ncbi:flagellar hook-length control protein FliK [Nocardioides kribbensis]|uniref:flagellar hook-length control protein FliK n=1 Tax=Nocardioides kribbensis TaxID=305517 RepID=UPI0031D3DA7E